MNRRFVDTPEAIGEGSAATNKVAGLKRKILKLRFYVGLTSTLALLLALALASVLWSPTACAASTDVHPARPGYSRVVAATDPVNVEKEKEKKPSIMLKANGVRVEEHKKNVFALFAATVAWVIFLIF